LVDPITEIEQGERHLQERLAALDLEQLRDVVAEYRMDPNKLVMKWNDRARIIDQILTTSINRGRQGRCVPRLERGAGICRERRRA
jgi:hypothetical protein